MKVLDFGIAQVEPPAAAGGGATTGVRATAPGAVMGTIGYMAPEQVRGSVTEDRVRHLCEVAHRECYIANSVTTEITVEPAITFVP